MKANLFLLSFLAATLACAQDSVESTEPITGDLSITDGQTHAYTQTDSVFGTTPDILDVDNGTISVTGQGSVLSVTTDGGMSLASGGVSDIVTIQAENGGIVDLTSTANSKSDNKAPEWF